MKISGALFDIGNVLLTFDHSRGFAKVSPKAQTTPEALRVAIMSRIPRLEVGEISTETFLGEICQEIRFTGTLEEFGDAYCDIFELNLPQWDLVRTLGKKIPLCLFSNTSELHETYIRERYQEFSLFPHAVMSWRVGCMKPEDAIYQAGLTTLGVPSEEILYIDDLPENIAKGKAFGFQTHTYDPNNHAALLAFVAGLTYEP